MRNITVRSHDIFKPFAFGFCYFSFNCTAVASIGLNHDSDFIVYRYCAMMYMGFFQCH